MEAWPLTVPRCWLLVCGFSRSCPGSAGLEGPLSLEEATQATGLRGPQGSWKDSLS